MDIQLVRTFLEVNRTRHFAQAAEALFITQAAVSARIAQLEQLIGTPLFKRQRNNIQLTAAGERLVAQAELLVSAWNRLLLQSSGIANGKDVIAIGCLPSISELYLNSWLAGLAELLPNTLLQIETLNSDDLLLRMRSGSLDVGLLYEPLKVAGMTAIKLARMALVLVSSTATSESELGDMRYIQLNWGASYDSRNPAPWEQMTNVALRVDSPRLARDNLLQLGGAAMLPLSFVEADLNAHRLFRAEFAEPQSRDIYLIQRKGGIDEASLDEVVQALRAIVT